MANIRWRGDAAKVAQVNTVTPANVAVNNTFSLTINGKSLTYTATTTNVSEITAGLVALVRATTIPEFAEVIPQDNAVNLTLTAATPGTPFTQTSSAAGGTATLTTTITTTGAGPNDWSVAANWDS